MHKDVIVAILCFSGIGHFTVVCSVTSPTNGCEAADDLVLIQTHCFYHVNCVVVIQIILH